MTKKKVQASTLKTMPMSPPTGGRKVPKGFNPYKGTKEEEIETLKLVFRMDGSNPYKDDAYNIKGFEKFKPSGRHDEAQYNMYLATLHGDMDVEDCYTAIVDMMRHMISSRHIYASTTRRYQYSPALLAYLHQVTLPPAKMPPAEEIIEVDEEESIEEEFDFSEVQDIATKDEEWIIKERKERDQRTDARERTKARLTRDKKEAPPQIKDYSVLEDDDDDEEDDDDDEEEVREIFEETEDDAISRLGLMEQELLKEQEETKNEILGDNNTERYISDMIERKLTERVDRLEKEWELKRSQVSEEMALVSAKAERVKQMEHSVSTQAEEVFKVINEATRMINTLEMKLTLAQDRIEEVDKATDSMADFLDAATTRRLESTQEAKTIATGMRNAKQNLVDTQEKLLKELRDSKEPAATRTIDIKEIQKESKRAIGEVRMEKDRNIKIIEDKTRSIREELQKLTTACTTTISSIGIDTNDAMDIKTAKILDIANFSVESVISGKEFETTLHKRMNAYLESYPIQMEEAMMKFTSEYFKDNDTLEHYIRDIAGTVIDISAYRDQLAQEVHQAATKWMSRNMGEDNQSSDEESEANQPDDPKNDKEEEEENGDEYKGGRPNLFADAHWRRTEEDRKREARATQENELKRTTHVSKAVQRFESKPMHSHCIPTKDMLDMDKAQQLYNEMYDDCLMETLPLTKITDLVTTESCIPTTHKETDAIIETISHAIMRRLLCVIPITNTGMLEILGPFNRDRDGYGALYAIMRRTCTFMKPTPQGWGPEWTRRMTPSKYVTTLQSSVSDHEMRHKTKYTELQQSQEMLYQALQSYNPSIATKLTGELNHWINANPTMVGKKNIPSKWKITGLADQFSDYHQDNGIQSLSIKQFDGKKNEGGYAGGNNKRFELRNKKQCACCKMAGHNIGDQVCRIGAQMWHAGKYEAANTETYKLNADKYFKMNRPIHINRVMMAHPTHRTEEEVMEECEKWIIKDDEDNEKA